MIVNVPHIDIFDEAGKLATQFIFGEAVEIIEEKNQYGQKMVSAYDDYIGYGDTSGLIENSNVTHKTIAITTPVFADADLKSKHICNLSINSMLSVTEGKNDFSNIGIGWVYEKHITDKKSFLDFSQLTDIAKNFVNIPYLWGGKTSAGLDCSALIQMCFMACGIIIPRDTSQQCEMDWQVIDINKIAPADLVFWDGHIGMMIDNKNIIHANASDMMVKVDSLENVITNIKVKENKDITTILRYPNDK